ncbi:hypothetical protein HAX54_036915 [Datura stramonium]|uniref:RAB6-interacting golgin n=1 Tax=Datura stramonium TaxID=4076 RepID=A0ABS8VIB5_DATST|nr:hypothetical protein [Datura stramonium]
MPSMEIIESPASQPLRPGPGRPWKQRSDVTEAPTVSPFQVSATTSTLLGSTSDRPLEVSSDEEETMLTGVFEENLDKAKEKKKSLKRQIEDLKTEVANMEHEEEHLKHEEIKYKEAHEVAKAKMQELGTQLEAAQAKRRKIEQRKNAALREIESATPHLQSEFLDYLY